VLGRLGLIARFGAERSKENIRCRKKNFFLYVLLNIFAILLILP
jgi:hypothetical protein